MTRVLFICGCLSPNIETRKNLATMDSVSIDDEGFLNCSSHKVRRYGWRSIPSSSNHPGMKFPYLGMSHLEVEGRIVFRDLFLERTFVPNYTLPDTRDIRDPEKIGKKILGFATSAVERYEKVFGK